MNLRHAIGMALLILFTFGPGTAIAATSCISPDGLWPEMTLIHDNGASLRFRVRVGTIQVDDVMTGAGNFTRVTIPGFHGSTRVGEPSLPMMNRLLEIPVGATPRLEVISLEKRQLDLAAHGFAAPVMPLQPSLAKSADPAATPFHFDSAIYQQDVNLGAELIHLEQLGRLRSMDIGRLEVAPVRYNPARHTLEVVDELVIEISFPGADPVADAELKAVTASSFFNPVYDMIAGDRENHGDHPDRVGDLVTMVVVTHPMFESQLADFVAWKTRRGFNTILAVTGTPEVGSTKEQIRDYLHDLYNNATAEQPAPSFVLFVGDVAQMPTWTLGDNATDRPYCAVDGDLIPDMYYGRFSSTNSSQLQAILDKTLMYDQFAMPDPGYLAEVVMIAGMDSGYGGSHGNGQINYGTEHYFNAAHGIYSNTYLYPSSGSNAANIVQNVSDGVSYINYTAHGSTTSWSDPGFSQSNINGLQNDGKYCLAVGNCCLTGSYQIGECFAETWLRAANKGAIGYIGGSNSTYWDEDYWWGVGFHASSEINGTAYPVEDTGVGVYDGLFHDHGEAMEQWYVTNDAIVFCGNLAVTESGSSLTEYYWNIYNLMGDPSLSTYMGVPEDNPVSHGSMVPLDATTFAVSGIPGSYVGITGGGVLMGAGTIGATGTGDIGLWNLEPGAGEIVVMCQNRTPYFADILIGAVERPTCEIDPNQFQVILPPGGSTTEYLSIGNEGEPGSVLHYTLQVDDPIIPDRNISGSTLTPSPLDYIPGATIEYTLTVYNNSSDYDWLDQVTLDLPTGVVVIGSTDFIGGEGGVLETNSATGDGVMLVWNDLNGGWGNVYGGASATAQVTLAFTGGAMGDLAIPFTISGDDYGDDPHDIAGHMMITGPSGPTVTLIAPDGGELWPVGQTCQVLWSATGGVTEVAIELSRDGGRDWEVLAAAVPADSGSFDWTVTVPLSGQCLVRVASTSGDAEDISDGAFYIYQPITWLELPVTAGECEVGEYDNLPLLLATGDLPLGQYHADIVIHSNAGEDQVIPVTLHVGSATGVEPVPATLALDRNWPNPFNPTTHIAFSLPRSESVELAVFDAGGRRLRVLVSGSLAGGRHRVSWDGRDDSGREMASGLYFYRLAAGQQEITRKMLLMK
jgi:hypothetical protein